MTKIRLKFLVTIACLTALTAGCSSPAKTKKASQSAIPADTFDPGERGAVTKTQTEISRRVNFNPNELITKISEYIAQRPDVELEDVAQFANSLRSEIGLPFTLVTPSAEIIGTETFIKTTDGQRLNVGFGSEPLCATGIAVTYPVLRVDGGTWTVVYNKKEYLIKASALRVGEIRRTRDDKVVAKVVLTEEGSEPGAIEDSGESIFVRFDLNPNTSSWWQRVMKRNPREEKPFLILEMSDSDFEFSGDKDHFDIFDDSPARENLEDDLYRLRFEDSKYYFQSTSCG